MILRKGDMFTHISEYNVLLVTTNAMVKRDGALVMGRGAALTAMKLWPWLPGVLGEAIKDRPEYGVIIPTKEKGIWLGAFQVKHHWRDEASLDLILASTWKLNHLAHAFTDMMFAVNFPGIGNGRLERDKVLPGLTILPDNVHVWEL